VNEPPYGGPGCPWHGSETFEALLHGLQDALGAIGGAPPVWRSDNLSAATHQLPGGGRELNRRFAAVLEHYGASSTRIEPGESHQNGIAEKAHHVLKSALTQALIVRGSRDFSSVDAYMDFVGGIRDKLNEGKPTARLAEEKERILPLPSTRLPEHTNVHGHCILSWAEKVGPKTRALCEVILHERHHPEWGFRSCLGLFRLAKTYGDARVEAACARALYAGARSYRPVKTILQHCLDAQPLPAPEKLATGGAVHGNVRGRGYYRLSLSNGTTRTSRRPSARRSSGMCWSHKSESARRFRTAW